MDRKTGEFENGRWRVGAQGLYAEYGNRVLLKHLSLNAGTFYCPPERDDAVVSMSMLINYYLIELQSHTFDLDSIYS